MCCPKRPKEDLDKMGRGGGFGAAVGKSTTLSMSKKKNQKNRGDGVPSTEARQVTSGIVFWGLRSGNCVGFQAPPPNHRAPADAERERERE